MSKESLFAFMFRCGECRVAIPMTKTRAISIEDRCPYCGSIDTQLQPIKPKMVGQKLTERISNLLRSKLRFLNCADCGKLQAVWVNLNNKRLPKCKHCGSRCLI